MWGPGARVLETAVTWSLAAGDTWRSLAPWSRKAWNRTWWIMVGIFSRERWSGACVKPATLPCSGFRKAMKILKTSGGSKSYSMFLMSVATITFRKERFQEQGLLALSVCVSCGGGLGESLSFTLDWSVGDMMFGDWVEIGRVTEEAKKLQHQLNEIEKAQRYRNIRNWHQRIQGSMQAKGAWIHSKKGRKNLSLMFDGKVTQTKRRGKPLLGSTVSGWGCLIR